MNGGARPVASFTLLPVGEQAPTRWQWTQFATPEGTTDIDEAAGFRLIFNKGDENVLVVSNECGVASGTYTVDGTGQIDFELDDSAISCDADSPAGQLACAASS